MSEMPPHAEVLSIIISQWTSSAVCALAELGVPDHLESGPRSVEELAEAVGAQPDLLYRLMRATASVGVLAETPDGKFEQTPRSEVLRTDARPTMRYVGKFNQDEWHIRGWGHLAETVRTGQRPIEAIYGLPAFEYFGKNPDVGANFNQAMTDLSTVDAPAVAHAYDFRGLGTLTDVGGGHGLLLATVLAYNPDLKGQLFDLPHVIAGASGGPTEAVKDRVTFSEGDMFESVPAGSDAYMMKYIIHDWPDDLCIKILRNCRDGVNDGGKLLVIDSVVPTDGTPHVSMISDLEMMLFPSGKERTASEFSDLFADSGWQLKRILPTSSHVSVIEGVPV